MNIIRQADFGLTLDVLQELMVAAPSAVISHQVGKALLHKTPLYDRTGRAEIRQLLTALIEELRTRLFAEGLEAFADPSPLDISIPKRLRDEASYLAALLTFFPAFVDDNVERLRLLEQGVYWARIARDGWQEALLWQIRAWRNMDVGQNLEAIADYRKGVKAALSGKHSAIELELRSRLIELLLHTGNVGEAEEETNALRAFVNERFSGDTQQYYLSRPLRYYGRIALQREEHAVAARYLEEALNRANEATDPVHYGANLFSLATAYHGLGESARAIEVLIEVGEVSKRTNRTVFSARALALTGEIHLDANELQQAEEAFELAERLVANANLPILHRTIQSQKLPLYLQNGQISEGIALARELLDHIVQEPERAKIVWMLGLLLEKNGDVAEAEIVLRTEYQRISEGSLRLGIPLARILASRQKDKEALTLLTALCSSAPEDKNRFEDYADGLELLSEIARRKGQYNEAIEWLKQASDVRLSSERSRSEKAILNAKIFADNNVREQKTELLQKRRVQSEEKLAELLTGLQVTHGTLLKIERRLRENLAWLEPEQMEQVVAGLKDAMIDPEAEQAVEQVVSEADAILALHGVDEAFFDALRERYPTLTKKQGQLCGMIRAGLKTSQIAHLLGVTANAVLTQRKRLRKRMGLSTGENLKAVVMGVGLEE